MCITFLAYFALFLFYHLPNLSQNTLFYLSCSMSMFTRDLSKHQFVYKNHYNKKSLYLTPNYFYIIIHSPFHFPFFLAINPFSCISFILVLTVLSDLLIILAISSCLIVGLLLIIFIIAFSSKVQFLHFRIVCLHFENTSSKN